MLEKSIVKQSVFNKSTMKTLINLTIENEKIQKFFPQNSVSPSDIQNCQCVFDLISNDAISVLLDLKKNAVENNTVPERIKDFIDNFLKKRLTGEEFDDLLSLEMECGDDEANDNEINNIEIADENSKDNSNNEEQQQNANTAKEKFPDEIILQFTEIIVENEIKNSARQKDSDLKKSQEIINEKEIEKGKTDTGVDCAECYGNEESNSNNDATKTLKDIDILNFKLELNNVRFSSDALAYFLIVMKKLLLIQRIKEKKEEKLQHIDDLESFLKAWKKSKEKKIHQTTFGNVLYVLQQFRNLINLHDESELLCFSSLTTDVCENHFSLIRSKNPIVTCISYVHRCTSIFYIHNIITNERIFEIEKKKISKSYNNSECKLTLPIISSTIPKKSKKQMNGLRLQFKKLNENEQTFVFRNTIKRGAIKIICPIADCTHHKLYSKVKWFSNHLATDHHKIPFAIADKICYVIEKKAMILTNRLESEKRSEAAKNQTNPTLSTAIDLKDTIFDSKNSQNSADDLENEISIPDMCDNCGKKKCKKCTIGCCKSCCTKSKNCVCSVHNHNALEFNISDFSIFFHDFETTGTNTKIPVEYTLLQYDNNGTNKTAIKSNPCNILVSTLVKPREKINYNGYRIHRIGEKECIEKGMSEIVKVILGVMNWATSTLFGFAVLKRSSYSNVIAFLQIL